MDFCRCAREWRISAISCIAAPRESREILDFPAVFSDRAKRPAGTSPAGLQIRLFKRLGKSRDTPSEAGEFPRRGILVEHAARNPARRVRDESVEVRQTTRAREPAATADATRAASSPADSGQGQAGLRARRSWSPAFPSSWDSGGLREREGLGRPAPAYRCGGSRGVAPSASPRSRFTRRAGTAAADTCCRIVRCPSKFVGNR